MTISARNISFAIPTLFLLLCSCESLPEPPPLDARQQLVEKGRQIFFSETFNGNGRTCGTCHPAENNFTIDPDFIATLPPDNPLFVAEFTPALKQNFENPRLMRECGLILENLDGFEDLEKSFVMRGVPHVLGLRNTIASPGGPRLGWSGDGSPGDHSLRSFAVGAVIQHFTKSLNRVAGVDFRLPTEAELDALEAFQLSLGRQEDLALPLPLKGTIPRRGQELFMDSTVGKCTLCHRNAGATTIILPNVNLGNANLNTGVEDLPDIPQRLTQERVPRDDGFGAPGDSTFNVPSLVEAASTGPFFHNNAIETIEGAVAFYDGESFNTSPAGKLLARLDPEGKGIELDGTQTVEIAAFLRVINALENIRQTVELLQAASFRAVEGRESPDSKLKRALARTGDAVQVLAGARLHPAAVQHLQRAKHSIESALDARSRARWIQQAIQQVRDASKEMTE